MKIAYVTHYDSQDVSNWSGTGFFMGRSLERTEGVQVDRISTKPSVDALRSRIDKVLMRVNRHLLRQTYDPHREVSFAKRVGARLSDALAGTEHDVVLAPGVLPAAYAETGAPVAIYCDATLPGLLENAKYYYWNLSARSKRQGMEVEAHCLERCCGCIFSSQWALDTAVKYYGFDQRRALVQGFGANLETLPQHSRVLQAAENRRDSLRHGIRILFVGGPWLPKGGDRLLEAVRVLQSRGTEVAVDLVGASPPGGVELPRGVVAHGFLRKNNTGELSKLSSLFEQAHVFVLPTRADCTPVVFSEAAAFGLPVIAPRIPSFDGLIKDGETGELFPVDGDAESIADSIERVCSSPESYLRTSLRAREHFETELDWSVGGRRVRDFLLRQTKATTPQQILAGASR